MDYLELEAAFVFIKKCIERVLNKILARHRKIFYRANVTGMHFRFSILALPCSSPAAPTPTFLGLSLAKSESLEAGTGGRHFPGLAAFLAFANRWHF